MELSPRILNAAAVFEAHVQVALSFEGFFSFATIFSDPYLDNRTKWDQLTALFSLAGREELVLLLQPFLMLEDMPVASAATTFYTQLARVLSKDQRQEYVLTLSSLATGTPATTVLWTIQDMFARQGHPLMGTFLAEAMGGTLPISPQVEWNGMFDVLFPYALRELGESYLPEFVDIFCSQRLPAPHILRSVAALFEIAGRPEVATTLRSIPIHEVSNNKAQHDELCVALKNICLTG